MKNLILLCAGLFLFSCEGTEPETKAENTDSANEVQRLDRELDSIRDAQRKLDDSIIKDADSFFNAPPPK